LQTRMSEGNLKSKIKKEVFNFYGMDPPPTGNPERENISLRELNNVHDEYANIQQPNYQNPNQYEKENIQQSVEMSRNIEKSHQPTPKNEVCESQPEQQPSYDEQRAVGEQQVPPMPPLAYVNESDIHRKEAEEEIAYNAYLERKKNEDYPLPIRA